MKLTSLGCRLASLATLSLCACSKPKHVDVVPPLGARLTRVSADSSQGYPIGRKGSGFGDGCSVVLEDPATGSRYLLVRSQAAKNPAASNAADSSRFLMAIGDYALLSAAMLAETPQAQFRVDCLKSQVVDSSYFMIKPEGNKP